MVVTVDEDSSHRQSTPRHANAHGVCCASPFPGRENRRGRMASRLHRHTNSAFWSRDLVRRSRARCASSRAGAWLGAGRVPRNRILGRFRARHRHPFPFGPRCWREARLLIRVLVSMGEIDSIPANFRRRQVDVRESCNKLLDQFSAPRRGLLGSPGPIIGDQTERRRTHGPTTTYPAG